jgi:hypothetical protein
MSHHTSNSSPFSRRRLSTTAVTCVGNHTQKTCFGWIFHSWIHGTQKKDRVCPMPCKFPLSALVWYRAHQHQPTRTNNNNTQQQTPWRKWRSYKIIGCTLKEGGQNDKSCHRSINNTTVSLFQKSYRVAVYNTRLLLQWRPASVLGMKALESRIRETRKNESSSSSSAAAAAWKARKKTTANVCVKRKEREERRGSKNDISSPRICEDTN